MTKVRRFVSSALLIVGLAFVLLGFNAALGFTIVGLAASIAAIASLLYAGAVWLGPARPTPLAPASHVLPLIVFDRAGRIVSGPRTGEFLTSLFPEPMRDEIVRHSSAALAGSSARFRCEYKGRSAMVDALPVRNADGTIVYGMLVTADPVPVAAAVPAHAS